VTVSVSDAESFQIYFSGEVAIRGGRNLKGRTSLLQGLVLAGGLTDFASGQIYLIRRVGETEVKRYVTTYKDLLRGRKTLDFYYLERGDIIHAE
jgi:protein involved in polysaccharide export with SLBB domain